MTAFTIILFSILLSAFFSGMEIAMITSNKMQFEFERKNASIMTKMQMYLVDRPKRFITTMLIGNTIALVIYGYFFGQVITNTLINYLSINNTVFILLFQTFVSTILILVAGEYIPKAVFSHFSNYFIKFFTIPAFLMYWILSPITYMVNSITHFFLRLFKANKEDDEETVLKEELSYFISEKMDESQEEELDNEIQIFHNALNFSDIKARDGMIPRNEIIALDIDDSIEELKHTFIEKGLSKILIYKDTIDHIIGYVHAFDLYKKPNHIKEILLPISVVHETTNVKDIMNKLIKAKKSIAVVLNEYGSTSGIITLEDIVEEIIGDIEDEHDKPSFLERELGGNKYLFAARLDIDYLNDKYNLNLPENSSYETLGGLVVYHLENIPEEGETIKMDDYLFTIKKVSHAKIEEIEIEKID